MTVETKEINLNEYYYDYYNKKWVNSQNFGTITTGSAKSGSGTFLVAQLKGQPHVLEGEQMEEKLKVKNSTKKGYLECDIGGVADLAYPSSNNRRARVQGGGQVSPTLAAVQPVHRLESKYRIRKLTEKECWRLMSFSDEDYEKARAVNSKTQMYRQAGNSIVEEVLKAIFSQMHIQGIPTWNEMHNQEAEQNDSEKIVYEEQSTRF